MRFELKQVVFGVHFEFDTLRGTQGMFFQPLLHNDHQPSKITFKQLTVSEHHKVRNEHDNADAEPTCDGFMLVDDKEVKFANQYPVASSGSQTAESEGDYRFFMYFPSRKEYDEAEAKEHITVLEYCSLTHVLERLMRGIRQLSDPKLAESKEAKERFRIKRTQVVELYDRILKEFSEKYPQYWPKCVSEPIYPSSTIIREVATIAKYLDPEEAKKLDEAALRDILEKDGSINVIYPQGRLLSLETFKVPNCEPIYSLVLVKCVNGAQTIRRSISLRVVSSIVASYIFKLFVQSGEPEQAVDRDVVTKVVQTVVPEESVE